ncbi:MAG: hypothetical protein KAI47_17475 [Deltaproteobacteria bacterium]|nr:hypothetical protein [Deltaproteobacteria bacterium]
MDALRRYILSAPPQQLAGEQRALLHATKIDEFLQAARSGRLTDQDVATFAQSVHPKLLAHFEKSAGLARGYFLTTTRSLQFPGGNPFLAAKPPSAGRERQLKRVLARRLLAVVRLHRRRGGKNLPHALQLLTSVSHLVAPGGSPGGDRLAVQRAVESIPTLELERRAAYIGKLTPKAILARMPSRKSLAGRKSLVNFDHLLGALGKVHEGKLLVEIYAENVPGKRRFDRFLPVTALGEGSYCVDDIARTTVALLQSGSPQHTTKARAGLRFVAMMQAKDGEFYNFANLKGGKLAVNKSGATSKKGIDFWAARALWAMGEGYATLGAKDPRLARKLTQGLLRTLPRLEESLKTRYGRYNTVQGQKLPSWLINGGADQTAVMLKGLLAYYRGLAPGKLRRRVGDVISKYADGIAQAQVTDKKAADYGRFFHSMGDPTVRHLWGSRQVEVLAEGGKLLGRADWIRAAARCADHYWGKATPSSILASGEEQIAYGIESVVSGYARLFEATGNRRYAQKTSRWASWLFGNNKARAVVYDPISGRGYDGIRPVGVGQRHRYSVNSNAGAESTVEAVLALQSAGRVAGVHAQLRRVLERNLPR